MLILPFHLSLSLPGSLFLSGFPHPYHVCTFLLPLTYYMPRPPTRILTKNNLRQAEGHIRDQLPFYILSDYEPTGSSYAVVSMVYYLGHKY